MRIMVDTNILISALVFRSEHLTKVIEKAAEKYTLVICSYVINEINTVIERKFPNHKNTINKFLSKLSFELVYSPKEIEGEKLFNIRDENDYIILHTAIIEDVDVLITGDKDFAAVEIDHPEILTPTEFLSKY
ncbi:MAG: putative toxin-antitoxin system toxin component, PIN family [Ruminiclostridium sp.]|nr:putative toxin-antitoxin system toxin component, PIN family [Ruminiclostridium sp.]